MMRRVQKTDHAEADIEQIGLWIARNADIEAALKWFSDLDEKLRKLAQIPGTGTDQSHLCRGLRSSPFGNYLIFFQPMRGGIRVMRVIHGDRDYRRFFE